MELSQVFMLLGGIALFLFGMKLMGDGLGRVSGSKLAPILYRLSGTPTRAVLLGTGVTAVLQSSCATSVMTVGFVNSGMMKVRQAVGVILGSILGTSITGWIVCLNYIEGAAGWGSLLSASTITGVTALIGCLLRLFSKKQAHQHVGDILLGFAVLMLGMSSMSGAVSPLRENEAFVYLLTRFENPLLGILVGMVFTAILQSASAAVGILQALSVTGAITFESAFPMLLGVTVGASFPVLLSALGANTDGKRAALIYPVASAVGVVVCAIVYYAANAVFRFSAASLVVDPFSLAAINTVFRLILLLMLAPFSNALERVVTLLVPEKSPTQSDPFQRLDERFLSHPGVAVEQCLHVMDDMTVQVRRNIADAFALLRDYSDEGFVQVQKTEDLVDRYEDKLGTYIVRITTSELTPKENEDVYQILHAITDMERISDHAMNIAENAQEIHEKCIPLSDEVLAEMSVMERALTDVLDAALRALTDRDLEAALRVDPMEEHIDELCSEMTHRCVDRMTKGLYTRQNSFVFNDLVTNYERISDHCSNIAAATIEHERRIADPHYDEEGFTRQRDDAFDRSLLLCRETYSFD